jgi:uncharacterized membrane protein YphA (DoxX/SURF4 family)
MSKLGNLNDSVKNVNIHAKGITDNHIDHSKNSGGITGSWIAFVRIFVGVFWLVEVFIGINWKIGTFSSGLHPGWFGSGAGQALSSQGAAAIESGTWGWFAWVFENIIAPFPAFWGYLVIALQLIIGIAFILGLFVRPVAFAALFLDLSLYMIGSSRIPPFFTVGHLFMLATNAGMYYGVDAWLKNRLNNMKSIGAKLVNAIISCRILTSRNRLVFVALSAILAIFYLLNIPVMETTQMQIVSLELAVIFGLVTWGLFASIKNNAPVTLAVGLLRIFIGYKFLHEIWVMSTPALNGLPGWGSGTQLYEVFTIISEQHWSLISYLVDSIFLTVPNLWAFLFATVQLVVGVMLILGWKTRLASRIGLVFLGLLIVLGFTRYTPFVFGYLVIILTLNGGSFAGFDGLMSKKNEPAWKAQISPVATMIVFGFALVSFIGINLTGVTPGGYQTTMGGFVAVMISIFCTLFGITGLLQIRAKSIDQKRIKNTL